ncbi:hypothetical protein FACS189431_0660 [Alphaproteobacteria bacterium]|nr:hypothetical protein FACS189431_0660 [Alphaproteobacteria bacterium]
MESYRDSYTPEDCRALEKKEYFERVFCDYVLAFNHSIITCGAGGLSKWTPIAQDMVDEKVFKRGGERDRRVVLIEADERLLELAQISWETLEHQQVTARATEIRRKLGLENPEDDLNFVITDPTKYTTQQQKFINRLINDRVRHGFNIVILEDSDRQWNLNVYESGELAIENGRNYTGHYMDIEEKYYCDML